MGRWVALFTGATTAHASDARIPQIYLEIPVAKYATVQADWRRSGFDLICGLGIPYKTINADGDSVYVTGAVEFGHPRIAQYIDRDRLRVSSLRLMRLVPMDAIRTMQTLERERATLIRAQ
jgi:hypothetical protein